MKILRLIVALFITAVLVAACSAAVVMPVATREPGQSGSMPSQPAPIDPDQPVQSEPGTAAPVEGEPVKPVDYAPQPGDAKLSRGNVYLEATDLLSLESFPPQFVLSIEGSLPNPCYSLRVVVNPPDADHKILVDVYSVYDPSAICAEVIKPFAQGVPLGKLEPGQYTVLVNGSEVGQVVMP